MGHRPRSMLFLLALGLLALATPTPAQRLGPPAALQRHLPPALDRLPDSARGPVRDLARAAGRAQPPRQAEIALRLQRHPAVLDIDAAGAPVVRGEVVAIDPTATSLARATAAGFGITGEHTLPSLGMRLVVLRAAHGLDTRAALATLRRLDPEGHYDYNHLYVDAGSASTATQDPAPQAPALGASRFRVGLIDSGVASDHPALASVQVHRWGCGGEAVPGVHGTAVASLLAGSAGGTSADGTVLYSADIYCGLPAGGAVTGYAAAMEWMARERVPVINLSLVGPDNALLRQATIALVKRGHLLVAAVGNDGPAAPPLYPAAYPGVIAVTAVDDRARVLPEAGRGHHVTLAATGKHPRVARPDGGWSRARGTSYAAPLVARAAAVRLSAPDSAAATRIRALLAAEATDLGERGRDDTYGYGLIGTPANSMSTTARTDLNRP